MERSDRQSVETHIYDTTGAAATTVAVIAAFEAAIAYGSGSAASDASSAKIDSITDDLTLKEIIHERRMQKKACCSCRGFGCWHFAAEDPT
ncbi:hypothetical protein Ancab_022883 [Ancistrocladus abbreviatus]